jgi:hypothetical protein
MPPPTPALRGHADVVQPASRVVVRAAGGHHAQHLFGVAGRHGALAREGLHAVVGEGRGHVGEVTAVHQDGALPEVVLEARYRIAIDDAEVLEHPCDRTIAEPGVAFGAVHRAVDGEGAAGERVDGRRDALPLRFDSAPADEARRRDRTCIDHRVERRTGLGIQADAVEGVAARLDTDPGRQERAPAIGERCRIHERLADRLDREQRVEVACAIGAVHRDQANAELVGIDFGELRDVRRDCAGTEARQFRVQTRQVRLQGVAMGGFTRKPHAMPRKSPVSSAKHWNAPREAACLLGRCAVTAWLLLRPLATRARALRRRASGAPACRD